MCVARLLGQGRIVVSADQSDVVIFRGILFYLAVSRCGVSTVQNPVAIANRYRLQPVAIDSYSCKHCVVADAILRYHDTPCV